MKNENVTSIDINLLDSLVPGFIVPSKIILSNFDGKFLLHLRTYDKEGKFAEVSTLISIDGLRHLRNAIDCMGNL